MPKLPSLSKSVPLQETADVSAVPQVQVLSGGTANTLPALLTAESSSHSELSDIAEEEETVEEGAALAHKGAGLVSSEATPSSLTQEVGRVRL